MLKNRFEMFHFSEQVNGDNYYFDYKIRSGPCSSGNAIKLLGIKKYPQEVLNEANNIVRKLANDKKFTIE